MHIKRLKYIFFSMAGLALLFWVVVSGVFNAGSVRQKPGILAPESPTQVMLPIHSSFQHKGYRLTPKAAYHVAGKVLSRRRYRFDRMARFSTMDVAMGWKELSDQRIIDQFKVWQRGRYAAISSSVFNVPIDKFANIHLIPSSDYVRLQMHKVRKGEIIKLTGMLVDVSKPGVQTWTTSLSRTDRGLTSCEILWVESIDILPTGSG